MKFSEYRRTLRGRLSLFTALLTLGVLSIFCTVTSIMLYYEQIDVLEDVKPSLTEEQIADESWDVLEDLFSAFAWALPISMVIIGAGSWWLIRRELRPLENIIDTAEQINARTLSIRLPHSADASAEIVRLVSVFNATLARLDQAFQQNLRFTADASHELRTPLTIMRGELEAALQNTGHAPLDPGLHTSLLEQVQRLSGIAEQLLFLARADSGRINFARAPVDVSALLGEVLEDAAILGDARSITLETDLAEGIEIQGDAPAIRRVFLNLIENAIKHNDPGGRVTCMLRPLIGAADVPGSVFVEISNTGRGVPPDMTEKIFQRFVRVDESRSRETGGAGLGLGICREIVSAHGGLLQCDVSRPGWTTMRLVLPLGRIKPVAPS